jgi:OOP family OmpA-OmpF porin
MLNKAEAMFREQCGNGPIPSPSGFVVAPVSRTFIVKTRFLFMLVTAWLIAAGPVLAENLAGTFTLSPFAAGQGFPFGGETHYDGDVQWGTRAGYNFTEHFRVELVFGANQTVHDPEVAFCTVYQYGADLLYAFQPDKKLVPFVSAGFGGFEMKYDGTFDTGSSATVPLSDESCAYFNWGFGVEYALTKWFALRTEFHDGVMLDRGDHVFQGSIGFTIRF